MIKNKSVLVYGVLSLLFVLLSLLINITSPLIILSVILLGKLIPLSKPIDHSTIRVALAVILELTLFNIFGLIFCLLKIDINANIYAILSMAVIGILFVTQSMIGRVYKSTKFSKFDLITIIPVILVTVFLLGYIFINSLSFSENLIRFMGSSSDQSAHLSIFNDTLRNDGNYVYSSDDLSINTPGINSYPMGWHQAMATLSSNLVEIDATTTPFINVVTIFFMCAFFTFLLFSILLSAFTGLIYDMIHKRKVADLTKKQRILSEILVKSFVVLLVTFLFSYITFSEFGYVNFLYASAIFLLCSILLMGIVRNSHISVITICLFALLLFAAVESWYIMALPLGIIFLILSFIYLKENIKLALRPFNILIFLICCILLGVAFLSILYKLVIDGSSEQIIIGNGPAAWLPNSIILLSVIVIATIFTNNEKKDNLLHIIINGFFVSILLLTVWNFLNLQAYSYYQQKMLFAFFALCSPITFIIIIKYLQSKSIPLLLSLLTIPFIIYTINPVGTVSMTEKILRPTSDPEISIIDKYFQSKFNDKSALTFIKDYRKDEERFTESYTRLLLSKVVSPGDCYNQLALPLISLGEQIESEQRRRSSDVNKVAAKCYGNVNFFQLIDNKSPSIE